MCSELFPVFLSLVAQYPDFPGSSIPPISCSRFKDSLLQMTTRYNSSVQCIILHRVNAINVYSEQRLKVPRFPSSSIPDSLIPRFPNSPISFFKDSLILNILSAIISLLSVVVGCCRLWSVFSRTMAYTLTSL